MSKLHLVGMSWNYNEGDILEEVLTEALPHVDALYLADGNSTDRSWEIMQSIKARYPDKIVSIQQEDEAKDRAQRNSLLNKIRADYPDESTWVQVFESDMIVLNTDIRKAIEGKEYAVTWEVLNAVRPPGEWRGFDTYPNWDRSIRQILPYAHYMERLIATFKLLPKLRFLHDPWRPNPRGWSHYTSAPIKVADRTPEAPLLLHVGHRGPTHFHTKYKRYGKRHPKYPTWRVDSPENVERTVSFYNGVWNKNPFPASREGWLERYHGTESL